MGDIAHMVINAVMLMENMNLIKRMLTKGKSVISIGETAFAFMVKNVTLSILNQDGKKKLSYKDY